MTDANPFAAEHAGEFTSRGWTAPASGLTLLQADVLVQSLDQLADKHEQQTNETLWALADVLVWCEDHLGDAFSQVAPVPKGKRRNYLMLMRISRSFEDHDRRRNDISVWAHSEVYNLPEYIADELLEDYATGTLNRDQLREEAQKLRDGVKVDSGSGTPEGAAQADSEPQSASESNSATEPACPLCLGAGHVPSEEREAYLRHVTAAADS